MTEDDTFILIDGEKENCYLVPGGCYEKLVRLGRGRHQMQVFDRDFRLQVYLEGVRVGSDDYWPGHCTICLRNEEELKIRVYREFLTRREHFKVTLSTSKSCEEVLKTIPTMDNATVVLIDSEKENCPLATGEYYEKLIHLSRGKHTMFVSHPNIKLQVYLEGVRIDEVSADKRSCSICLNNENTVLKLKVCTKNFWVSHFYDPDKFW